MGIVKIALLSSAALCMGVVTGQAHAQEPVRTYDLPAQDLATALRTIARGSDYQLVADAKSLKGARAPSLAGAYTVEEAVAALLAPSGLTAEIRDRTITLRGRDAPSREEVTGATDIQLSVTGSRIRGAKPTSPVISASREQITELGHSDLGSFARSIPQNFSGGQNPGVISSTQSGSENTGQSGPRDAKLVPEWRQRVDGGLTAIPHSARNLPARLAWAASRALLRQRQPRRPALPAPRRWSNLPDIGVWGL